MTTFPLIFMTPDTEPVTYTVESLSVNGMEGDLGILAGHQDALIMIQSPTVTWSAHDGVHSAQVTGAILQMTEGRAFIYAETLAL